MGMLPYGNARPGMDVAFVKFLMASITAIAISGLGFAV